MKTNDVIWWNGQLVPWAQAHVHVTSDTALRGLNVFEGMRAYWRPNQNVYAILGTNAHLTRLAKSCELLSLPATNIGTRFRNGISDLLRSVPDPSHLYLRPTVYVERGAFELDDSKIGLGEFISWRRERSSADRALRCMISRWIRIPGNALPSEAKIGAAYTAFRLARLEAMSSGHDEAILLNDRGRIAETPGGSVFVIKDGTVSTPPIEEGILPSITRRVVLETLCPELSLKTEIRSLNVADLHDADEAFIAGTLDEISRITAVGQALIRPSRIDSIVLKLQALYQALHNGTRLQNSGWMELVTVDEAPI